MTTVTKLAISDSIRIFSGTWCRHTSKREHTLQHLGAQLTASVYAMLKNVGKGKTCLGLQSSCA